MVSVCTVSTKLSTIFLLCDGKLSYPIQSILVSFLSRKIESVFELRESWPEQFCRGLLENKGFTAAGVGEKETSRNLRSALPRPLWLNSSLNGSGRLVSALCFGFNVKLCHAAWTDAGFHPQTKRRGHTLIYMTVKRSNNVVSSLPPYFLVWMLHI